MQERTFIGLDVHARSVQAGVLDGLTGEVKSLAVPVATKALVAWICAQPAPAVTSCLVWRWPKPCEHAAGRCTGSARGMAWKTNWCRYAA